MYENVSWNINQYIQRTHQLVERTILQIRKLSPLVKTILYHTYMYLIKMQLTSTLINMSFQVSNERLWGSVLFLINVVYPKSIKGKLIRKK